MEEEVLIVLDVTEILAPELINEPIREYNPQEWLKIVKSFQKYKDCVFYKAAPQRGYDYPRYFARYEISHGLIFFKELSYCSMLTSNGFCRIGIDTITGVVRRFLLNQGDGKLFRAANNPKNRRALANLSQLHGFIWSNEF